MTLNTTRTQPLKGTKAEDLQSTLALVVCNMMNTVLHWWVLLRHYRVAHLVMKNLCDYGTAPLNFKDFLLVIFYRTHNGQTLTTWSTKWTGHTAVMAASLGCLMSCRTYMNMANTTSLLWSVYCSYHYVVVVVSKSGQHWFFNGNKDNVCFYRMLKDAAISSSHPGQYPPFDQGVARDIFIKNASGDILIGKVIILWLCETTPLSEYSLYSTMYAVQ